MSSLLDRRRVLLLQWLLLRNGQLRRWLARRCCRLWQCCSDWWWLYRKSCTLLSWFSIFPGSCRWCTAIITSICL
uniref:Uncharacterized protein n=1 Tax=Panstrongylus lignarius TaxID=156445 RepID=A0A224Y5N9_9HEMI